MCGISGIINKHGLKLRSMKAMSDIVKHRGPDDEGFVAFREFGSYPLCLGGNDTPIESFESGLRYQPTANIDNALHSVVRVVLGHRRLSILDLSPAGHQPMCYRNGRYWIVLNGEIYNYLEIREELISHGSGFVSKTDTEVVLAAYAQWGTECLNHFNGMWAFAIYDREKREVFLSRDRYGIKPLYYWISPNGDFCFGSEIKQFTVMPGWSARLNPQRSYDYLVFSLTDHTDETMFNGVYQIPPGHYLKTIVDEIPSESEARICSTLWYAIGSAKFKGTIGQAAIDFRKNFQSAVKLHLRADVPVGCALSGGLDSSAIVCEVNRLLRSSDSEDLQKTFSSCSVDERYDERKWVDEVVRHTAVNAHYVYPQLDNLFDLTPDILWHMDEPYQSQSVYLGYHVFQIAKANNVKVLLNGQGADEYLGGYGQFRIVRYANMFRELRWVDIIEDIRNSKNYGKSGYLNTSLDVGYHLLPDKLKRIVKHYRDGYKGIKDLFNLNALGAQDLHPYDLIPIKPRTVPEMSRHLTFYSTLPRYLKWEDRNSMAHSIEARVPFLDFRLVEFVYGLPDDYLEFNGVTKRIMRLGLNDILPSKIINRKDKKGFITPEERWVKEDTPHVFRARINEAIGVSKGIIKPNACNYIDKVINGQVTFDCTYWRIILFSEWIKTFNICV